MSPFKFCLLPFFFVSRRRIAPFLTSALLIVLSSGIEANPSKILIGRTGVETSSHSRTLIPLNYRIAKAQQRVFHTGDYTLRLFSRSFRQGEIVYVEILPPEGMDHFSEETPPGALFEGNTFPLTRFSWGYRGFFGISPYQKTGKRIIQIRTGESPRKRTNHYIEVQPGNFPVYKSSLNLGSYSNNSIQKSPEVRKEIQEGVAIKKKVFSTSGPDHIGHVVSHPRDMHRVTSPYWATRKKSVYTIVNGKRIYGKPRVHVHRGLDLRGLPGTPVYAMADGVVVLARKLYYEGNFTVIDHGNRIYTLYMHQSKFLVHEGDTVQAGQKIGEVGATGAVTGAHLHVSLYVTGLSVDPESLLCLPVRGDEPEGVQDIQ